MKGHRPTWLGVALVILVGCGAPRNEPATITRLGDDLLGGGDEVRVVDSIVGDVMLAGGDLRFSGVAQGAYLGAGGNQAIGGTIVGSVRAAGGNVVLSGHVGRNVTIVGGNVVLDSGATITHNVYLAGGAVRVRGQVGGGLSATAREVVIDGAVGGDVEVSGSHLRVGPNARIAGALRHRVPKGSVSIDSGARITGGVVAREGADWTAFGLAFRAIWLVGFLVAGAIVVALFPGIASAAAGSIRVRPGAAAAFGVAWLVGIPLAIIITAVTIVGLPLAALVTAAYLILLYLGRAAVAVWLGEVVVRKWRSTGHVAPVLSFLIGGVLLLAIGLIPVIGSLIGFVVTVIGAGAVLVALWPRRQHSESAP